MNKEEIIKNTLKEMSGEGGLLHSDYGDDRETDIDDYVEYVLATLSEKLPETAVQTCRDFQDLGIACCECCHNGYAHFEMELESLHDGTKAWLCCAVCRALREKGAISESRDHSA